MEGVHPECSQDKPIQFRKKILQCLFVLSTKKEVRGTWVHQSVRFPSSAQVMIPERLYTINKMPLNYLKYSDYVMFLNLELPFYNVFNILV